MFWKVIIQKTVKASTQIMATRLWGNHILSLSEMEMFILCKLVFLELAILISIHLIRAFIVTNSNSHEGDLHEPSYDFLRQSINLTRSSFPPIIAYSLHLYPTEDFISSYSTHNPRNATICALFVIALVTILFFFYDFFVQREFIQRRQVLEAKRRFIRYVSHEVRSPLNAVLMGVRAIYYDGFRVIINVTHIRFLA